MESTLSDHGYKIQTSVRLQDVLQAEGSDQLDRYEDLLYYRQAHFDFVVCRRQATGFLAPVFAVEFDGRQHESDPVQIRRDELKNRFCKDAELPLLRITSEQIQPQERISVLEYMLELFLAWEKDGPRFRQDCLTRLNEWIDESPDERLKEIESDGIDPSFEPQFLFELEHPYPAIRTVSHRLNKMGVFTEKGRAARTVPTGRTFLYVERFPSAMGAHREHPDRWTSTYVAFLCRERLPHTATLTATDVKADPREAVQVLSRAESTAALKWGCHTGRKIRIGAEALSDLLFADLPGVSIPSIAENLAQYLCLREIQAWLAGRPDLTDPY